MCHGNLDPKFALRDVEDRLKGRSVHSVTLTTPAPAPVFGLLIRVRAAFARLTRKEPSHG
jgi:hypothetical protein